MGEYVISCCSTADLTKEKFNERQIPYVCFHYEIDGEHYNDDFGESIPFDEFYRRMQQGAMTKTSQINAGEYEEYFEQFLSQGKDVLHLCLSSGISGTINSAIMAKESLMDKYPDRKLYIVDSCAASSGYGLLMIQLADMKDQGMNIDDLYKYVEAHKLNVHHWFFSTDLTFFIRGGRVSKAAGTIGNVLNICPLLNVSNSGELIVREKHRGKNKVIKQSLNKMLEHAEGGSEYSGRCFISQSQCYEDARKLADLIEETFKNLNGPVEIFDIGTTIGSHTGPGTVALFFIGDKRVD